TLHMVKPIYNIAYKVILLLCKILLIGDILITTMAVAGRYISFIPDPAWSEQIVLTLMSYLTVLSAALAIRKRTHIRMVAFDEKLSRNLVISLDILSDILVLALGIVMIVVGGEYAITIGAKGYYPSMPTLSRFWMYFPIPLAGVAMVIFQLEVLFQNIKRFYIDKEES